ncbi:MAG: 2TM domain-containing protein, partial [Spirochaetaceae bacterium]
GVGDEKEDREIESAWDQVLSRRFSGATAPSRDPVVKSYREQTEKSLEQVRSGFRGHLISYVGVNGMLITIGIVTGAMPWLAIPALGWGIGLASHWAQVRQRRREVRELATMRNPTRDKLRVFRRITRARNSFHSHLISNGATSIFLFALNMMVSPEFPWFVFPVGGMAIGVLSHLPSFKSKERKLNAELAQITERTPAPRATAINPDASPVEQAEELQEGILGQIEELGQRSDVLGEDFRKLLTTYVEQVRALTQRADELDDVLDAHSLGQVGRELADLERKRGAADDRRLQNQYDETIRELEKHRKSIEALMSEREMIALRINSGLNMLKNVRIELVRLKTASGTRDVAAGIEAQSRELLGQLEDLRAAYEELNDTP